MIKMCYIFEFVEDGIAKYNHKIKSKLKNKIKVYKFRVRKKINDGKLPTIHELKILKDAGEDVADFSLFAIKKYLPFISKEKLKELTCDQ